MSYESKDLPPFVRGDDWTIKLNIKDSNKQAVDITGYTYYMTLKSDIDSADPGDLKLLHPLLVWTQPPVYCTLILLIYRLTL
jgi:hypothetical protein